jgi:hypothetical protein
VVALQYGDEAEEEPRALARARHDVERLEAGLSRALLSTSPDVLRAIADRAARAEAAVARWQARVGERPALDESRAAAVDAAVEEVRAARAGQDVALRERHRLLATGNGAGLLGLGVAGGLVLLGSSPMALPVAVAVTASPIGPIVASWMATQRCSLAARRVGVARREWADALHAAGAPTMGALAAQRIAVKAWERRAAEAAVAVEAGRPHQRAWYRLAGPGVPPTDVEDVLARIEALRQAQLRLLGLLIESVVERQAMEVLAPAAEVAQPAAAPSWLEEALERFRRANRPRLFGS